MKALLFFAVAFCLTIHATAQSDNPDYNKKLADSLGADDYGMKMYVLVLLKAGTNKNEKKETADSLFRGHFENILRLVSSGKLIVSGPLKENEQSYQGIFILNVKTIEEASALLNTDPAIKKNHLAFDLFQWYGSAALPMYLQSHYLLEKKKM